MKKLISIIIVATMLLTCSAFLFSCDFGGSDLPPEGTVTRVTVDVNPSIEFMVDDQNKVVAVTALNDDGALIIAGEEIVGKTPEEATKLVLEIAHDTGYIVDGEGEYAKNEIKISVSGDSKYQEKLTKSITAEVNVFVDTAGINATISEIAALTEAELQALAITVSAKTQEEIANLTENELYQLLEESRIETATLLTAEMRDAYNNAKAYEVSFTKRAEYAAIIEGIGGLTAAMYSGYQTALDFYHDSIIAIENYRYEHLISPESDYQKALLAMRENKEEYLKERQYVASLDVNGTEYASAVITLQATEAEFDAAYNRLVACGDTINAAIDLLINKLEETEATLKQMEESFPADLAAQIDAKAKETEEKVNLAKDQFFTEFEAEHLDDIEATLANLEARKAELKANKTPEAKTE